MVSLNPPTSFIAKRKGSAFLGADADPQSEYAVLTFNTGVTLIQPNDNKVIKSWSCTRGRKNTDAALFAPEEKEFVLVQNGNALRTFPETDYESAQTFTLNHKVKCLVRCHQRNPLVMFEDGSIHHLHHVLANPKGIVSDSTIGAEIEEILFTSSFTPRNENMLVCSICTVKQNYHVLASTIHNEESHVKHLLAPIKYDRRSMKAASSCHSSKTPTLVTIWDDGSLCLLEVQVSDEELHIRINQIAKLEIDKDVSITSLSDDQAAILCKDSTVVILDLKFGTIHCKTHVKGKKTQLSTIGNYMILDASDQLEKMTFTASPVTLASAILKHKIHGENSKPISCAQWNIESSKTSLVDEKDSELIELLLKTNQETTFDKSWTKLWKDKSQLFREQFSASAAMQNILSRFGTDDEKYFWPKSTILKIVTTCLINGRWCCGIMRRILQEKDWMMLLECTIHLNDIPEDIMVMAIQHIVECDQNDLSNGKTDTDSDNFPQHLRPCLHQILQLPYSENLLHKQLASMPFGTVMKLVWHLTALMQSMSLSSSKPTLEQVISWLSMLLDAHISEILILEDCWSKIYQLHETVKMQGAIFKELSVINRLLLQIESKLVKSKKSNDTMYSVEIMRF